VSEIPEAEVESIDVGMQMMDESARLLAMQQQLEKDSDGKVKFFGMSISETIRTCLMNGMSKKADKVKSEFKVSDKRWVVLLPRITITQMGSHALFDVGSGISNSML
jgi:hypothetical protein